LLIDTIRGRGIGDKVLQLDANQRLSAEEVGKYKEKKLKALIQHAIETVPYYRKKYGPYRSGIRITDIEPVVKSEVQQDPKEFVSDAFSLARLRHAKTSGSTGKPLMFYYDDNLRAWNRAATARSFSWWGVKYGARSLRVWGMPISKPAVVRMHMTYLLNNIICKNVFKLSELDVTKFVSVLKCWKPMYAYGYTSGIYEMAKTVLRAGLSKNLRGMVLTVTTSEMLHDHQRHAIKQGFGCDVAQEYGVGEVGIVGFECPQGSLHVNDDLMHLETDKWGVALVTSLVNTAMPLMRYNTGDIVELRKSPCACGLPFAVIHSLKGRYSDLIDFKGKVIHSEVFDYIARELVAKDYQAIENFRVIRRHDDELLFEVVPGRDFNEDVVVGKINSMAKQAINSDIKVSVSVVKTITRTDAGKIRFYSDERIQKAEP